MQVSVESTGKLERRMQVQVPAERVSKEIAARLKDLSRTARLKGFRPGKAPITVIKQQFGPQVHREVIGELLQSSYEEAVTQNQLTPAGSPRIEPQSMDEGQDLKYTATFEVFPEVVMQPIESLQIDKVTADVTESDIDAMIERLRKQQVQYAAVSRGAQQGDKVTIDFEGAIDGTPFAGGKGENIVIVIGMGGRPGDPGCIVLPRNTDMTQPAQVAHDLVQPRLGVRRFVQAGDDRFDKLARQPDNTLIFGLDTRRRLDHQPRDVDGQTERKDECQKKINPSAQG